MIIRSVLMHRCGGSEGCLGHEGEEDICVCARACVRTRDRIR